MKLKGAWKYLNKIIFLIAIIISLTILLEFLWPDILRKLPSIVFIFIKKNKFFTLGSFSLVSIAVFIKRLFSTRHKKRKELKEKFYKYFENIKKKFDEKRSSPIESPRVHPAALVLNNYNAKREQNSYILNDIRSILDSRKINFFIFELYGTEKQGKSVILWSIAEEISKLKTNHIESWCVKESIKFLNGHEDWYDFFKTLKDYLHICRKSTIILFWDFPLESLYPNVKKDLSIKNAQELWIKIKNELSENNKKKIILITTSRNLYPHNLNFVKAISSTLMETDVKPFLEKYCDLKRTIANKAEKSILYTDEEITVFLKQPGIFEKYRGNMLYLLFLFEKFIRGQRSISILDILDEDTRKNIDNYNSLNEENKKKEIIRFIAFANLLGLSKLKGILSGVPSSEIPYELLWIDDNQGTINLANPFLGYYIHQEEIRTNDFDEYLKNILTPRISQLIDNLQTAILKYSMNEFKFLRDVFHYILEETYRPIIQKNGYFAAKKIFNNYKIKIFALIENKLLPFVDENPSFIWLIREWASTFRRLGEWDIAEKLFIKTIEMIKSVNDSQEKVKILIPLAWGLSSLPKKIYNEQAIKIYNELLENSDNLTDIDIIQLSDQALALFKKLNRFKEALEFLEKIKNFDSILHLRVGEIFESMGYLEQAEQHFRESIKQSEIILTKSRSKMNSWHRYALFLIKHYKALNHNVNPIIIEGLLKKAEVYANELNQNVSGIYSAWGKFFHEIQKNNEKALIYYKKAANWCEVNNIPNSYSYSEYANYIIKRGLSMPNPENGMVEAETWLKKVIESDDFDSISKKLSYNMLGRLVGGMNRSRQNQEIIKYNFNGKERPDYNEAIEYLKNSFASEEDQQRFDSNAKTWQDVLTHAVLADLFRYKSKSESNPNEKKESLNNSLKHIKAAYEGLPRFDLDGEKVKKHILNAMDNHAHILWEMEDWCYSIETEECWENTIIKITEWVHGTFNFPHTCEIYNDYGWFIWKTKIEHFNQNDFVPLSPLRSTNNIPPKQSVLKALDLFYAALKSLSEDRKDYHEFFNKINIRVLMSLRALFSDSIYRFDQNSAREYMAQYLKTVKNFIFAKGLCDTIPNQDILHIKQFLNNDKTKCFLERERDFYQEVNEIKLKCSRLNDN